uniref:Uncharacterized protein n=1 Tax=Anguilla anguilla TaxID=7936 RepID=A0A0E9X740_ANGAN
MVAKSRSKMLGKAMPVNENHPGHCEISQRGDSESWLFTVIDFYCKIFYLTVQNGLRVTFVPYPVLLYFLWPLDVLCPLLTLE